MAIPRKMERTKKKVEWSQNLSSVENYAPENRSPQWDSETDHLLSYFLGGDQNQNGVTNPQAQLTTTPALVASALPSDSIQSGPLNSFPYATTMRLNNQRNFNSGRKANSFDDDIVPPPTPATQYYHHSSSKSKSENKSSGSSQIRPSQYPVMSSASSSAAAFGPESLDPEAISPLTMLGPGHEELMLPPSPEILKGTKLHQPSNFQQQPQQRPVTQQPRQSHLQWLEHINNLAKQASTTSSPGNGKVIPPQPSSTQLLGLQYHTTMPPPAAMPYPNVSGVSPTLAAGGYVPSPIYYNQHTMNQLQQQSPIPESEEKRAKRLERNRESARKSRRRKKERLSHLEEKVSGLHNQIEAARRADINSMNAALQNFLIQRVVQLENIMAVEESKCNGNVVGTGNEGITAVRNEELKTIFERTGTNCTEQREVVDFQYSTLKQTLLPKYQKFLLWLTLLDQNWFMAGKEQMARRESGKNVVRLNTGKISSKQVGEELTNGHKLEDGTIEPPVQAPESSASGEKGGQTSHAFDALRMWPLLCFELSISVDQEERIIHQAHKSAKKKENLQHQRSQIEAAVRMTSRLKEAVLLQSHNAMVRSNRAYLDILTPKQTVLYYKWLANNRERCRDEVKRNRNSTRAPPAADDLDEKLSESMTLIELCRKLEAVLQISKRPKTTDGFMTE